MRYDPHPVLVRVLQHDQLLGRRLAVLVKRDVAIKLDQRQRTQLLGHRARLKSAGVLDGSSERAERGEHRRCMVVGRVAREALAVLGRKLHRGQVGEGAHSSRH
eukprot:7382801-Prymnesium_polylepis.1